MRLVDCLCGARIEAAGTEALAEAYIKHTEEVHADLPIPEARKQEAYASLRRTGGWDGTRETLGDIEVVPLTPELRDDYLRFFDGPALCDNPAWGSCYCISYQMDMPNEAFDQRSAAQNRADKAALIDSGDASGVLAFERGHGRGRGRIVGWCHAAAHEALPALKNAEGFHADEPNTAAIVCFVVAPHFRGQGVARRLLDGALEMLRARGFAQVDAYPPADARTAAGAYHGTLSMYIDAGFNHVRDAGRYVVVRKLL